MVKHFAGNSIKDYQARHTGVECKARYQVGDLKAANEGWLQAIGFCNAFIESCLENDLPPLKRVRHLIEEEQILVEQVLEQFVPFLEFDGKACGACPVEHCGLLGNSVSRAETERVDAP